MKTTTTAEFRAISKGNIKNLINFSSYKKIEGGGFLGLFKKVEYQDNFESYLAQNTQLIDEMTGKGFLYFDDMVAFLKKYKSIDLKQPEYADPNIDMILEREENAYFLDFDYVNLINEKLSNISVENEELTEFNNINSPDIPMADMIVFQQDQIKKLSLIFKLFRNEVMYIRCELSQ
ncbi:hypothetical protein ABWH96_15950 [Marivirga tractuosa]|uniref:hypothetical protein n=1 Tax=Marivirga tractuosa TaxID=1006 RepID=UPI0035D1085F